MKIKAVVAAVAVWAALSSPVMAHRHHRRAAVTANAVDWGNVVNGGGAAQAPQAPAASTSPTGWWVGALGASAAVAAGVWLVRRNERRGRREQRALALAEERRRSALAVHLGGLATDYPHLTQFDGGRLMMMDRPGRLLRFQLIDVEPAGVLVRQDIDMSIAEILSIELKVHSDRVTTTETETRPTIAAAILGPAYGPWRTRGSSRESTVHRYTELIFSMRDLANPMRRFESAMSSELETWAYRIRTALARRDGQPALPSADDSVDR